MMEMFATGALLGLSFGLSPGPLMALVIAQSLRHGAREGCKIALSPLATDLPIIVVTLLVAARAAGLQPLLGGLSIAGGLFVLCLAWDNWRPARIPAVAGVEAPRSWLKGILTNLFSPHPWLFWMTIGAAVLGKALERSWSLAALFLLGFYLLLLGSKVTVAVLSSRSRDLLAGRPYRVVMRTLAVLLGVFAVLLFREGLKILRS